LIIGAWLPPWSPSPAVCPSSLSSARSCHGWPDSGGPPSAGARGKLGLLLLTAPTPGGSKPALTSSEAKANVGDGCHHPRRDTSLDTRSAPWHGHLDRLCHRSHCRSYLHGWCFPAQSILSKACAQIPLMYSIMLLLATPVLTPTIP